MKIFVVLFVALSIALAVALSREVRLLHEREAELRAYKKSRTSVCDLFQGTVAGAVAGWGGRHGPQHDELGNLANLISALMVMADGCVALPESTPQVSLDGSDLVQRLKALDRAMSAAKARDWPLVRQR